MRKNRENLGAFSISRYKGFSNLLESHLWDDFNEPYVLMEICEKQYHQINPTANYSRYIK